MIKPSIPTETPVIETDQDWVLYEETFDILVSNASLFEWAFDIESGTFR